MQKCCANPYYDCTSLESCFENLAVRLPLNYEGASITLKFTKQGSTNLVVRNTELVVDGWAVVNIETLPQAFFNSFAGMYEIEFVYAAGSTLTFIAKDGSPYTSAAFSFDTTQSLSETVQLNIFDSEIYI